MKFGTTVLALTSIGLGAAVAQSTPTPPSSKPSSVATSATPAPAMAPVAGANSFTEGQARKRLEDQGYTNVTGLKKDDQSIWRGTATKGGASMAVALDYQGNVVGK